MKLKATIDLEVEDFTLGDFSALDETLENARGYGKAKIVALEMTDNEGNVAKMDPAEADAFSR